MLKATAKPIHYAQLWGKAQGSHQRQAVPRWVTCDANEFIRMLNAGELTPCSDEEWARICRLLHMEPGANG